MDLLAAAGHKVIGIVTELYYKGTAHARAAAISAWTRPDAIRVLAGARRFPAAAPHQHSPATRRRRAQCGREWSAAVGTKRKTAEARHRGAGAHVSADYFICTAGVQLQLIATTMHQIRVSAQLQK